MVEVAASDFLSYLRLQKRVSTHTISNYNIDLKQFQAFLAIEDPTAALSEINFRHIRAFSADLMEKGLSAVSVNRKLSALKSFFKYLLQQGEIQINPTQVVSGPKKPKRLPTYIEIDQLEQGITEMERGTDFVSLRNSLIIDLLYQTGLRRAELLSLKEADIDLHLLQFKVLGKRNKERILPFSNELAATIKQYFNVKHELGHTTDFIFVSERGLPLNTSALNNLVKAELSKMTTSKKRSPHVLRHSFATHLLNNGADINAVKELLGHSSLAATQVYTHNSIEKLKQSYKQAHPRSGH
jgi:integrase/recombinase XerC